MSTTRDYYEILGVERGVDKAELKRAYRKLALKYHPDKNKSADAEDRFKEISESYAVLSDDEKRQLYDRYGHAGVNQRYTQEDIFRGADFGDVFGDLGRIFESFFGGGFGPGQGAPSGGRNVLVQLRVSLEDAFHGTKRAFALNRQAPCKRCEGRGAEPGSGVEVCSTCHGRGQQQFARQTLFGNIVQVGACQACAGQGSRVGDPCKECRGQGATTQRNEIEIAIPAGVEDGERLRLRGQGELVRRGGQAGDLYVEVHVDAHPRYARDGPSLLTALPVDYATLALGGRVHFDVFDGDAEVNVPAASKPGQRLRLRGYGMPKRDATGRGDLYLQLELHVPKQLSKRAKELLEELRTEIHANNEDGWFGRLKKKILD